MSEQRLIDANRLIDFIDCGHLRNPLELCFSESEVVNMLDSAPTVPAEVVVHCENCQHIHIINTSEIYAMCDKTNFIFQPFGVDTREFGCTYGERRESEAGK